MSLLHEACKVGDVENVESLLKSKCSIDEEDESKLTPLHVSSANGFYELTEMFIAIGADVNPLDDTKKTPLQWAKFYHGK